MKNLIIFTILLYSGICFADLGVISTINKSNPENKNPDFHIIIQNATLIGDALGEDEKVKYIRKHIAFEEEKTNQESELFLNTRKVLYSNYIFSIIIFASIHIALFLGLYTSIREILESKSRNKQAKESEVSISYQSINIKTIMNGTVLFSLTLILYFIFIKYVYPVTIIDLNSPVKNIQTESLENK